MGVGICRDDRVCMTRCWSKADSNSESHPRATPDADPIYLYTDDVIGILPKRNLNNGQPSLHAALIAAAAPQL